MLYQHTWPNVPERRRFHAHQIHLPQDRRIKSTLTHHLGVSIHV
jgi:hypothetical protein